VLSLVGGAGWDEICPVDLKYLEIVSWCVGLASINTTYGYRRRGAGMPIAKRIFVSSRE